ncbi:MAG: RagB/SusD family nutrient uptake outer membrane protein [Chitinophagaceae bacterium]|nr:RagB/SusD family nutrient uptake outer membrane protein [Chitinophagaceae bacterium]
MKKNQLLLIMVMMFVSLSCDKASLDKSNPNALTPSTYFKNVGELTRGVNAVYAIWQSTNLMGREYFFLHDLRSDEVASGGGQLETPRNQVLIGAQNSTNSVVVEVWNGLYRSILRANTVIDNSSNAIDATSPDVQRIVGEAKFLRALAYTDLVSMWGAVPLHTTVATSTSGSLAKSPEAEVYARITRDLLDGESTLPLNYGSSDLGRATKGAAQMLLARAYMNQGKYDSARLKLQSMISSGAYKLESDYNNNFIEETEWNGESVFEIGYGTAGDFNWATDANDEGGANEKSVRSQEYSAVGWRNLIPSNSAIAEFEDTLKGDPKTDPRRSYSFYIIGDTYNNGLSVLKDSLVQGNTSIFAGITTKVSWRKYSLLYKSEPGGFATSGINHRLMRYSDALLMMAECENELDNPGAAIALLNEVRARANVAMPPYPTVNYPVSNKQDIFRAIVHERRVELGGDLVRTRDILRWLKNGKINAGPLPNFNRLLPIPQQEIDSNDKIAQSDQNPGY